MIDEIFKLLSGCGRCKACRSFFWQVSRIEYVDLTVEIMNLIFIINLRISPNFVKNENQ